MNTFKSMPSPKVTPKAEETGRRILDSALELFRQEGFDTATMRDIAGRRGVATGAAYYYYPSKDAIVMDFYRRSCAEMQPKIEAALEQATGLEARLRELIRVKLAHFAPNRGVLRALLRNGADPSHPLSPFSPQTREIREIDIALVSRHSGRLRHANSARPRTSFARRALVLSDGRDLLLGHRRIARTKPGLRGCSSWPLRALSS